MVTFFVPFRLYWRVRKQDGGGLVVFFNGLPAFTLYMVSLDIWDSSRDPMGDGSTLPHPMNSALGKTLKEPLNNTLPHTRDGWP